MVKVNRKSSDRVLVLDADVLSRVTDPADENIAVFVGDRAVLVKEPEGKQGEKVFRCCPVGQQENAIICSTYQQISAPFRWTGPGCVWLLWRASPVNSIVFWARARSPLTTSRDGSVTTQAAQSWRRSREVSAGKVPRAFLHRRLREHVPPPRCPHQAPVHVEQEIGL